MFWTQLLRLLLLFIQTFREIDGRVCLGHDQAPGYSIHVNRSNYLTTTYKGCKVIHKNVEIVDFSDNIDPTFLDTIEEVHGFIFIHNTGLSVLSMKNLRLVRGISLYRNQSIHIVNNKKLKNVVFPSLREIVKGNVHIEKNEILCYMDKILWEDITNREESSLLKNLGTNCPSCEPGCPFCWSEDVCQHIWRKSCETECQAGCLNGTSTCCDAECLSGCVDDPENCVDCRNFKDKDVCRSQCTGDKFHYGVECLEECPNDTVHHQQSCLLTCPVNHYVTEKTECKECPAGEECPQVCQAFDNSTNYDNIKKLENCTIIDGPLKIYKHLVEHKEKSPVPFFEQSLSKIREVTERVIIQGQHVNLTDLYFLRNLEIVKGKKSTAIAMSIGLTYLKSLNLTKLRKIGSGDLRISSNSYLESLDLTSLKEVGGQIRITNNSRLCYIDNSTFEGISNDVVLLNNKDPEECRRENKICDVECIGCWGAGNALCRFCRRFRFEEKCVPFCDLDVSFDSGNNLCKRCHSECLGCSGEGPENCKLCKNLIHGKKCIQKCPHGQYTNPASRSCLPCHSFCKNGCTGPSASLEVGGCNNCYLFDWKNNTCLKPEATNCAERFYEENKLLNVSNADGVWALDAVKSCMPCHSECSSCHGRGTSVDVCTCLNVTYRKVCQQSCPLGHYADDGHSCQECHPECDQCYGPRNDTCSMCKNVRVNLERLPGNEIGSLKLDFDFYCNSSCPPGMTAADQFLEGGIVQRICQTELQNDYSLESVTKNPKMMTGMLVVGGLGLLIVVAVIVIVMRIQRARAEVNKAKLEAHMKSMETPMEEVVAPTDVRPDLASIRLIKELELERGETIGSGAFGTVYRGIWRPEDENIKVAVAIKVLTEGSSSAQHKELLEEARVMASVNHSCCIRIIAVCLSRQMMLITPLVVHGSLLDYVRKRGPSIGSHTMLKWSTQIARGMNYLEQKGIVHRDLAARNILVRDVNQVKITDFGLAKLLTKEDSFLSTGGKVPVKWLALESIQHRIFTHKSDVWSYGVTLWELYTYGKRPYEDISALDVVDHLEKGERLPQPSICTIDVYTILFKCWEVDVACRPTFLELEERFNAMSQDSKRFLIIPGDKHRIPSDFVEDQRSELLRQMRLSESDDLVFAEDYLDPVLTKRLSSRKKSPFLAKLEEEEEETNFQSSPEYVNSPRSTSRPSYEHQPSSRSSGSADRTFSHLVAASAVLEGNRSSKSSDRYFCCPNECIVKESKSSVTDEKEFLKILYDGENYENFEKLQPNVDNEGYLEPSSRNQQKDSIAMFVNNPEYMEQGPEPVTETKTIGMSKELPRTTFGSKAVRGMDYYNDFSNPNSKIVQGIAYTKRDLL